MRGPRDAKRGFCIYPAVLLNRKRSSWDQNAPLVLPLTNDPDLRDSYIITEQISDFIVTVSKKDLLNIMLHYGNILFVVMHENVFILACRMLRVITQKPIL